MIFPSSAYGLENLIACPKVMLRPCLVNLRMLLPKVKVQERYEKVEKDVFSDVLLT